MKISLLGIYAVSIASYPRFEGNILLISVAVYWLTRRNIHEELNFHQRR